MKNTKITYTRTYEIIELFQRINKKKLLLDQHRPLPESVLHRLKEELNVEWTYNSNSIEGNTLSISETRLVLEDGITIGGKTLREHFEVINHHKAIQFLYDLSNESETVRCIDILSIHRMVMHNILDDYSGRFRPGMVRIVGANFTPPGASKVSDLLDELVEYVNSNPDDLDIMSLTTYFHHRFVWIHPFSDGNGRTARLAMNILLLKAGYPPAFILTNDRKKYIAALQNANKGNYDKLVLMMAQALERSLNLYLAAVGVQDGDFESLASIAMDNEIPYGQEYISLLARKGAIDAHKEGNTWVSTRAAVKEYINKKNKS